MTEAGTLFVRIRGDLKDLQAKLQEATGLIRQTSEEAKRRADVMSRALDKTVKSIQGHSRVFRDAGKVLSTLITGPLVAGTYAMIHLAKSSGEAADRLSDLSAMTGLSTTSLQEWQHVARVATVPVEAMSDAVAGLIRKLPRLEQETGLSTKQLHKLGLDFAALAEMTPDEAIDRIILGLSEMENVMERNAIGAALFGLGWKDIAPILDLGAKRIKQARQEAHALGLVLDEQTIARREAFFTQVTIFNARMEALWRRFGEAMMPLLQSLMDILENRLLPVLGKIADRLNQGAEAFKALPPSTQESIVGFVAFMAILGPVLFMLGHFGRAVAGIITLFRTVGPLILRVGALFASPLAKALGLASVALLLFQLDWQRVWNFIAFVALLATSLIVRGVSLLVRTMGQLFGITWLIQRGQEGLKSANELLALAWKSLAETVGINTEQLKKTRTETDRARNSAGKLGRQMKELKEQVGDNIQSFDQVHLIMDEVAQSAKDVADETKKAVGGVPSAPGGEQTTPSGPAPQPKPPDMSGHKSLWQQFGDWLRKTWQGIVQAWNDTWASITRAGHNFWDQIRTAWQEKVARPLGDWFSSVPQWMGQRWSETWSGIEQDAQNKWGWLGAQWDVYVQPIVDWFAQIPQWLGQQWLNVWNPIKQTAENIWGWISREWNTYVQPIIDWFGQKPQWLGEQWSKLWGQVQQVAQDIWGWISREWNAYVQPIIDWFGQKGEWLGQQWSTLWGGIKQVAQNIWGWISQQWNAYIQPIIDWFGEKRQWLEQQWSATWGGIKQVAQKIWEWISTQWATYVKPITDWFGNQLGGLRTAWDQAWGSIRRTGEEIWKWISGWAENIKKTVSDLTGGVVQFFGDLYNRLVGRSFVPDIVSETTNYFNQMASLVVGSISSMVAQISRLIGVQLAGVFVDLAQNVGRSLGLTGDTLKQFTQAVSAAGQQLAGEITSIISKLLQGTISFGDAVKAIFNAVANVIWNTIVTMIAQAVSRGLASLWKWVSGAVAAAGKAIVAFIQQAYAALVAFFAWAGPFAPLLAGGVIAAAIYGLASLVRSVLGVIGLARGGIVTGPTLAMLGEGGKREAVIPLERDNVLADSIGNAVFQAMMAAMRTAQPQATEREIVLRIDGVTVARAVLPALAKEADRQGVRVVLTT